MKLRAELALLGGGLVLAATSGHAAPTTAQPQPTLRPAMACDQLRNLQLPDSNLKITKAEARPAQSGAEFMVLGFQKVKLDMPAYCHVQGVINERIGAGGKTYGLTIEINLPTDWNGRFLQQGGGGLNGSLSPALGMMGVGGKPALTRGFAVVSTDGGHKSNGGPFDMSFFVDQQATADFAFNAVPTVAAVAKRVVASYYGRAIQHTYFAGCSTGGREGMEAVERYPNLFDGVVTGSPAMRTGHAGLAQKWAGVAFNRIAPKDPATGLPVLGGAFSASDRKLIISGMLNKCDGLDGVKDGMVFNHQACTFDPAELMCKGTKNDSCLSPEQVGALRTAFAGPKSASGRALYSAFPYDTGIAVGSPGGFSLRGGIPGILLASGSVLDKSIPVSIDVEAEEAKISADPMQQLTDTYNWTNLSTYFGHGGKHLLYAGASDPWFSSTDLQEWYARMAKDNGGLDKVRDSSRYFHVPGMGHCTGGPAALDQFDMLTPLVDWVEAGKAPDRITATGAAFPGRSRPLCSWPSYAHYNGKGSTEDAANFQCRR